ncbi:SRPBCC family protein [Pseudoalteromonas fenneropenaei]|uniref:SRPBCC family protein n=1 Tax=Pseudoalteromonas fenneropenaei TaxID=1737459 RepID=A0ABV7CLD4_9GAMM
MRFATLPVRAAVRVISLAAFLTSFTTLLVSFATQAQSDDGWQVWFQGDDITISQQRHPKRAATVGAHMRLEQTSAAQFFRVLNDVEHAAEWLPHVLSVTLVSRPTPSQTLVYSVFDAPFPVAKRQLLSRSCLSSAMQDGQRVWLLQVKDVQSSMLNNELIAISPLRAIWRLTEQGDALDIRYEVDADPNGRLPLWLVNFTNLNNTKQALRQLKSQLLKPRYLSGEHGFVAGRCDDFFTP